MIKKCVPWLMVILLALGQYACASKEEKRDTYINKGEALIQQGDYVRAKLEFRNSLKIYPDFPMAYYKLGYCESKLENWRRAFKYFNKAVELDPELWEAQLALAEIYIASDQIDRAKKTIDLVPAEHPQHSKAMLLKSHILIKEDNITEAKSNLENLIKNDPQMIDAYILLANLTRQTMPVLVEQIIEAGLAANENNADLLMYLAVWYESRDQLSKAEATYQSLTTNYLEEKKYAIKMAGFYERSDQPEKAEKIYLELIREEPNNVGYRANLSLFYENQDNRKKAIEIIKKAISDFPEENKLPLLLGEIYTRNDQLDQALATYKNLAKKSPKKPEVLTAGNRIANIYYLQKKTEAALGQLESVLKHNPKDLDAHFLKGTIFLEQGKGLEAVGEFRLITEEEPDNPEGYLQLGRAHLLSGDKSLAIDTLKKAVSLKPLHEEILDLLLSTFANDKAYQNAIYLLKELLDNQTGSLLLRSRLGDMYMLAGNLKMAEKTFLSLKEAAPNNPESFIKLSAIYALQKEYDKSLVQAKKALALAPENIKNLSLIVRQYLASGNPEAALKICRDHIKQVPEKEAKILLLISQAHLHRQDFAGAKKAIQQSIALAPDAIIPYLTMGALYTQQEKIDEGIAEMKAALATNPDNPQLQYLIATLYTNKDDLSSARSWYEKTIKAHPDFIPAINNLAYLYANHSPTSASLDKALKLLNTIPEKQRSNSVLDTLGWIYYQKEEYAKASAIYEKMYDGADAPPVSLLHIGLTRHKINHIAEAKEALQNALKSGKGLSDKEKQLAEDLLNKL